MNPFRCWWSWLILVLVAFVPAAHTQVKQRDAQVIFKDGFHIHGRIKEHVNETLYDAASGMSFPVPSGSFFIDDHVRRIIFTPTNVLKITQLKVGEVKEPMYIKRIEVYYDKKDIPNNWEFSEFSKWTGAGDRTINVRWKGGAKQLKQQIVLYTPKYLKAITPEFNWPVSYFTTEFSPEEVRRMLVDVFEEKKNFKGFKDLTEADKHAKIAAFMQEAGWYEAAETELVEFIDRFPDQKKAAEPMLERLRKERANMFVEGIKQANKIGQHGVVLEWIKDYHSRGYDKLAAPAENLAINDFKADYAKAKTNLAGDLKHLKALPNR